MFEKRWVLFELLGFKVQADPSWLAIALLVTWSLAVGLFPGFYPGLPPLTYWSMGVVGMLGLFLSIVLHELAHSLVARRHGLPIKAITLFIFGGVAEMEEEPSSPRIEFLMAIAGPIASLLLAVAFYLLAAGAIAWAAPKTVVGVVQYLAVINGLLAGFNLVPAFPLDGGRALRAALWHWKGDLRWATRIASRCGEGLGLALIMLAVVNVLHGNFVGGMWWFLIGLFVRAAARSSYLQLLTRRTFEGEPVSRFMTPDPVSVPPWITIRAFVEDYVYRYHHDVFPVTGEDGRLIGLVATRQVKAVPREEWDRVTVTSLLLPRSADNTVTPETDAVRALSLMRRGGSSRLMVADGNRLVGVVTLKDMLDLFHLKMDLEPVD